MNDSDKIKMFLNIGDQQISYNSPYDRQEFVRDVERRFESLYRKWRLSFPSRTDHEILAMVAFQFASYFYELKEREANAAETAKSCLQTLRASLREGGEGGQSSGEDDADGIDF